MEIYGAILIAMVVIVFLGVMVLAMFGDEVFGLLRKRLDRSKNSAAPAPLPPLINFYTYPVWSVTYSFTEPNDEEVKTSVKEFFSPIEPDNEQQLLQLVSHALPDCNILSAHLSGRRTLMQPMLMQTATPRKTLRQSLKNRKQ